jgi:glucokinase
MKSGIIIGIDVGGTKTAIIRATTEGEILSTTRFPTGAARGFEPVYQDMTQAIETAITRSKEQPLALSVAIGGPLDVLRGIIKSPPNLPGWNSIPLKEKLEQRFHLPVYVEHDGNAGALAEFLFGAGRGYRNIVFLTMGTGFGAGLILDGRIYRGTSDVAGEIGHIRIADDGPDCYGKRGSLEGYASGTGIARLAGLMFPEKFHDVDLPALAEAWNAGSKEASAVFERAALYLGRGFALIADLLNPERIILGGIGMRLRKELVGPAMAVFEREALPESRGVCEVVPASLGEQIGDYACLVAALDQGKLSKAPQP